MFSADGYRRASATLCGSSELKGDRLTSAILVHPFFLFFLLIVSGFPLCASLTAQRSAHELPMVEKQDMDSCSVLGGQQMILTGQNFSSDSKVIFLEKTQGEHHSTLRTRLAD